MINQEKWIESLPGAKDKDFTNKKYNTDPIKWTNTIPSKKNDNKTKKISLMMTFFIIGVISVSVIKNKTRSLQKEIDYLRSSINSLESGTAIAAAPVGVDARTSATKSAIDQSFSCPIPVITGFLDANIARATFSSLKTHKSSGDPPPLATIMVSIEVNSFNALIAFTISGAAISPCTRV